MINYFNFKKYKDKYLITNDFGRYAFLRPDELRQLLTDRLEPDSELFRSLSERYFVYDTDDEGFSLSSAFEMYSSRNYLYKSTSLMIFVVTSACNQVCVYCQAHGADNRSAGYMTRDTAQRAVDIALQSPVESLDFEFQGGEPLLNFDVIRHIVEYTESVSDKRVSFSVVSNLTLLTDEMADFFKEHKVSVSTSLDGDAALHNENRPYASSKGTYDDVIAGVEKLRRAGVSVGAIQTTSKSSLTKAEDIVDAYVKLGLHSIFIRPLTPLGCAGERFDRIGYSADEFLSFYRDALSRIIEVNRNGYMLSEGHARIFLSKILSGFSQNYMELRSPCGAMLGQLAFYHDGRIFTCDEARMLYDMGDDSFCLGDVGSADYNSIADSKVSAVAARSSVLESLPSCCDCVYQPYCGVCPVVNYAVGRSVYESSPRDYKCRVYSGMLDEIFDHIYHDRDVDILGRWIG